MNNCAFDNPQICKNMYEPLEKLQSWMKALKLVSLTRCIVHLSPNTF